MTVLKIFIDSVVAMHQAKLALLKAFLMPLLIINLLYILASLIPYSILTLAIYSYVALQYVIIAITTHRVLLNGPASVPEWGITRISFREFYYTLHLLVIILFATGVGYLLRQFADKDFFVFVPTHLNWDFTIFLLAVMAAWFISRLCLVFPGIAVDQAVSFLLSWRLTKQYQLIMFILVIVLPLCVCITVAIVYLLVTRVMLLHNSLFISAALYFLPVVGEVLVIAMLSIAYREIYQSHFDKVPN